MAWHVTMFGGRIVGGGRSPLLFSLLSGKGYNCPFCFFFFNFSPYFFYFLFYFYSFYKSFICFPIGPSITISHMFFFHFGPYCFNF